MAEHPSSSLCQAQLGPQDPRPAPAAAPQRSAPGSAARTTPAPSALGTGRGVQLVARVVVLSCPGPLPWDRGSFMCLDLPWGELKPRGRASGQIPGSLAGAQTRPGHAHRPHSEEALSVCLSLGTTGYEGSCGARPFCPRLNHVSTPSPSTLCVTGRRARGTRVKRGAAPPTSAMGARRRLIVSRGLCASVPGAVLEQAVETQRFPKPCRCPQARPSSSPIPARPGRPGHAACLRQLSDSAEDVAPKVQRKPRGASPGALSPGSSIRARGALPASSLAGISLSIFYNRPPGSLGESAHETPFPPSHGERTGSPPLPHELQAAVQREVTALWAPGVAQVGRWAGSPSPPFAGAAAPRVCVQSAFPNWTALSPLESSGSAVGGFLQGRNKGV